MRFRILTLAALTLAWATASHAAPVTDAGLARAIDAYVKSLVERGDLSGQLLVARHGRIVLERFYGSANRELGVPVTAESRFCVASITKPMTSIMTIGEIQKKTIGSRDSIARWLPDFPRGDSIRIEHILRHRSGIPHELVPDSLATQPRTAVEMVAFAAKLPLDFPPGTKSSYSSGGYTVLARILEIVTGRDYAALLEERLAGPLGMKHTRHVSSIDVLPGRVASYVPGLHGLENARLEDFSGLVGAGSVWSTARDIHTLAQAVATGKLGTAVRYSLVRGGVLEFSGRVTGFRSYCDWDSASGLEVVFVGNVISGAPDLLRSAVPRLAAGEAIAPPSLPTLRTGPVADAELARLEGDFRLENGTMLRMRVRDGALWANEWLLRPTTDGAFFSPRDYGLVRGVPGADGRIERLDWTQNGTVYPAPRVAAAAK